MKKYNSSEFLDRCKKATLDSFKGKLADADIENLLNCMPVVQNNELTSPNTLSVPEPIEAEASITSALIWSKVKCSPSNSPYNNWKMEESAWGPGIGGGVAIGCMYTAYETYDALFKYTTAYHVQGIADFGGILQITWFNSSGVPIGQFNGVLGGAGVFEAGGSCSWQKK